MISCQISKYISKDIFSNLQIYPKISQDIIPFSPSLSGRPATATGIGPTMCARLDDPSGSLHAHVWPQDIQADFSSGKAIYFQGRKTPLVRSSDPTIQFRSDLRYVPMLGTFLSYECNQLRSFGSQGLRGHLPKKSQTFSMENDTNFPWRTTLVFHGERHKFSMENDANFSMDNDSNFPCRIVECAYRFLALA